MVGMVGCLMLSVISAAMALIIWRDFHSVPVTGLFVFCVFVCIAAAVECWEISQGGR